MTAHSYILVQDAFVFRRWLGVVNAQNEEIIHHRAIPVLQSDHEGLVGDLHLFLVVVV